MLAYAIDTPAPATVVVISGDRDFVYAVSTLRLRQYQVIVIAPPNAHASLRLRASELYDWDCEVLCKAPPVTPNAPTSGRTWVDPDGPVSRSGHHPTVSNAGSARPNPRTGRRESVTFGSFNFNDPRLGRQEVPPHVGNTFPGGRRPLPQPFTYPSTPDSERRPSLRNTSGEGEASSGTSARQDSSSPALPAWRSLAATPSSGPHLLPPITPVGQVRA